LINRHSLRKRLDRLGQQRRRHCPSIIEVIAGLANADDLTDADRVTLALMVPEGIQSLYQRDDGADEIEQRIADAAQPRYP
jgi:hypothetical protein